MNSLQNKETQDDVQVFGFFLTEGFSLPAYTSIAETLRIANDISGKALFRWHTIGRTTGLLKSASGLTVKPDFDIKAIAELHKLAVISSLNSHNYFQPEVFRWLHKLDQQGCILGGITSGSWILANAKLLAGHQCTIHWHDIDAFKETYPELEVSDGLFKIDHNRFSCAGGFAALDLILEMIIGDFGIDFAQQINRRLIKENQRSGEQLQNFDYQIKNPIVRRAIYTMNNHIESPITVEKIADICAISQRQLVRLFQKNLQASPQQYYLKLRLKRAASLLKQTNHNVTEVSIAAGFDHLGHFSTAFKNLYECTPTKFRYQV